MKSIRRIRNDGMYTVLLSTFHPVEAVGVEKRRFAVMKRRLPLLKRRKFALNALSASGVMIPKTIDAALFTDKNLRRIESEIRPY